MSQNLNLEDGKIDLGELIAALWFHKFLIILITCLSVFLAGYKALTAEKKFTATAIFQIEEAGGNSGINLSGELGALASLAGYMSGSQISSSDILLERATGREFILKMKKKFSIEFDPFFNTYNPNYKDPFWKSTIKKMIGWQKTKVEQSAIIENNVIKNYRQNVKITTTAGGAISISVTHVDPKKAADYANNFMFEIKLLVENDSIAAQNLRLNYLSETLADSLQDMEEAQGNLKNYALANSAMAQENFISDSLKLDKIRMERRKVTEIANLLLIIENSIKSGKASAGSYEELRSDHPLVDDIDFRRILGMSETISAWTWPEIETVEAVSATLRDRIKSLDVNIQNIEENAKIYATSAEDLAKYTRAANIAEATYTVLIEQVKSQSLAAGFQPETFKVFEYATTPLTPSSPNRNLILALGIMLGLVIGTTLAILNSMRRGVYYTQSALVSDAGAELSLKSKSVIRLSRKSLLDINSFISKNRIVVLDEAALKLSNQKIIYVLNSGGKLTSSNFTKLLATQSAKSGRNVLLCDTTGLTETEIKDRLEKNNSDFPIVRMGDNISVIAGTDGASFFASNNFKSTVKDLTDRFDQIFLCSSNRNSQLGLMALSEFVPGLVLISSLRKTRKSDIKNIQSRQPIDLLIYD